LKIALSGLSSSGKTTLFNSFMGKTDFKGTTGSINVPDERLERLSAMYHPKKTVYAAVNFEDCLPMDTQGKAERVRLEEKLRTMDAFVLVVGAYRCQDEGQVLEELSRLRLEMIIRDLDFVSKRLEKLEKETKLALKDRALKEKEMALLSRLQPVLESERYLFGLSFDPQDQKTMANYNLLTVKPSCVVLNIPENGAVSGETLAGKVGELLSGREDSSSVLFLNARLEADISAMGEADAAVFMKEYGISELGRGRVIQAAFQMLNWLTFYTVGEDECRAWNIPRGGTALDAAGAIHSDLARGFIRAEVVDYESLVRLGSLNEARKAARLRLEGKTYVVKDGDIVHVMFNV
jgi:GTP-binding protein YchF